MTVEQSADVRHEWLMAVEHSAYVRHAWLMTVEHSAYVRHAWLMTVEHSAYVRHAGMRLPKFLPNLLPGSGVSSKLWTVSTLNFIVPLLKRNRQEQINKILVSV